MKNDLSGPSPANWCLGNIMHIDPRPGLSEESHYESDSWHSEQVTFLLVGTKLQHAVTAADTVWIPASDCGYRICWVPPTRRAIPAQSEKSPCGIERNC